jgi:ABC-2 type transport system ATP-binding protein
MTSAVPTGSDRSEPAIECRDLVVRYGSFTAVDGLSFTARRGEVLALLGPNGAGKTSTVETLEGYRRPAAGHLRVLGLDPQRQHRQLTARLGVMLERGGVYPMLSPRRVLRLFTSYYPEPLDPEELLERLGLRRVARTPWRRLSGGEQQRLALALALVGRPEAVILDEPTAGVDPEGRQEIRQEIAELARRGVGVLLTTHELDEAERLADRVLIIRHGQAVAGGTPDELSATVGAAAGVRFRATPGLAAEELAHHLGAPVTEETPGSYLVQASSSPTLLASLTAWLAEQGITMTDLRTGRSLEETYLEVVGSAEAGSEDRPARPTGRRQRR